MQVIWVIVTLLAIYSRTLLCSPSDENIPKHDKHSFDSEDEGDARKSSTSEAIDWEEEDSVFQNTTDGNEFGGLDEDNNTESFLSTLSDTNATDGEIEVTTTVPVTYVPEGRRRSQPRRNNITCGEPPVIPHAKVVSGKKTSYSSGAVITYSCEFGYVTDGVVRTAQCLPSERPGSLEWTKPEIHCNPRSCGEPGLINNGNRIGSLFVFPSSVSYECEDGYKLKGNRIRYCQPSGTWSGTLPTCLRLSCDPPREIENGRVTFSSLEFGSELQYQCNNGFILRKHRNRVCAANGTWSGEDPVCQDAQCDLPESPEHGSVQVIGGIDGKPILDSRAIYTCFDDRILVGSRTSICLETGEWTFPTPKCLDPCSVPEVPHGKIQRYERYNYRRRFTLAVGTKLENGMNLYLKCDDKYNPLGKSSDEEIISCNDGVWRDFPTCEPASCSDPPPPTPNADVGSIDRKNGGGVVYYCRTHFRKAERGNISCDFGSWKGNTPVCLDTRCYIDSIPFPGLVKGKKLIFANGQSFTPICEHKYTLAEASSKLTCELGTWKGHLPPCTAASCLSEPPPSIEHGAYKPYSELHGSTVTYECDEGFVLKESGSSKIQCRFGKWEGIPPTCKDRQCYEEDLQHTKGLILNNVITPNGGVLVAHCADGFVSTGINPLCSDGVWSQDGKPCEENNCVVYEIQNGHFTEQTERTKWKLLRGSYKEIIHTRATLGAMVSPSSSLFITCDRYHTFQGKSEKFVKVSCSKGKWIPYPACLLPGTAFRDESSFTEKIKVERISTTKRPIAITSRSPAIKEASLQRNLTEDLENSCTCTYVGLDDSLVAYSGNERLENGAKVKKNSNVIFHCTEIGFYRFSGQREIKCEKCDILHSSQYPQCNRPVLGDAIIRFENFKKDQPGGIIGIEERRNVRLTCISNAISAFPEWRTPTSTRIVTQQNLEPDSAHHTEWFTTILDIMNISSEHNGRYDCFVPGYRTKSIEIQVMSSGMRCPLIEENEDIEVLYDKGQAVNSSAIFSCKGKDSKLVGSHVLTCLSNGRWSGNPPRCELQVKCAKLEEGKGMHIQYSMESNVGSRAVFYCANPLIRTGMATSECKSNGQWSNPVPSCLIPNCTVEELFRGLPENVIPLDMENVKNDIVPYNFTIQLNCEDGSVLQGNGNAKCGADEKWEVAKVQCVRGCVSLQSPDSTLVFTPQKNVYRIGESVTLSCAPGEALSSEVVRLMCLNMGWSDTNLPHCQPK